MRTNFCFFLLIMGIFFTSVTATAQSGTANFDETWKEFLTNNKISNMSVLTRPDKRWQFEEYSKYLLMNINSSFCQSEVDEAEQLMEELKAMDPRVHQAIPKFIQKMDEVETKMKAYRSVDNIWIAFLQTKTVDLKELDGIDAARTNCEKATLAKSSFMTAYHHLCEGNVPRAKDIFENRTLRLTEKTTLQVNDVEGLAEEVAAVKALFQGMDRLEGPWKTYVQTGVSRGFDGEIPFFPCYPNPRIKVMILKGATDLCNLAPQMLEEIKELQEETGVTPVGELGKEIKKLEAAVGENDKNLATLNKAWEAFIPDNKVRHVGMYGYEYCTKEPLIRAYIMDGFAYTCEVGDDMLRKIDSMQRVDNTPLEKITMTKINELSALYDKFQDNGRRIQKVWSDFIANGDKLRMDYQSSEDYCDNIYLVEDWTIRGLTGTCEEGIEYLKKIEDFQNTFEFYFFEELECRVQRLRVRIWECRHEALSKLARVEAPDNYEGRLSELMQEYGVGERPAECDWD